MLMTAIHSAVHVLWTNGDGLSMPPKIAKQFRDAVFYVLWRTVQKDDSIALPSVPVLEPSKIFCPKRLRAKFCLVLRAGSKIMDHA